MKNIFLIFLLLFLSTKLVFAYSLSSLSGYAWSSNIGWIKFSGPGYAVDIDESNNLSGYAWSYNIGWIKFEPGGWAQAVAGINNPNSGDWDGLVHLIGVNYSVVRDEDLCKLTGWAWGSDVIGWIHFSGNGYGVNLPECNEEKLLPEEELPLCNFYASPVQVAKAGRSSLFWNCNNTADYCSISELSLSNLPQIGTLQTAPLTKSSNFTLNCSNSAGTSSFSTSVKVVRPTYCEIIPFLGKCR